MKQQNLIALCLGIFVAALLWQYYLWPKYQLKRETPEVMALIEKYAQKELEEAVESGEGGEVLFIGEPSATELSNAPQKEKDLVFYSQANKPKDLFEQMSLDETKKHNAITVDKKDFVLNPLSITKEEGNSAYQQEESRITMLQLPANFLVIKDSIQYKKFLAENEGKYPEVNFTNKEIVIIISEGRFADNFFEIVKIDTLDNEIKVLYRVNLMSKNKTNEQKNYKLLNKTDLPINFIQVK